MPEGAVRRGRAFAPAHVSGLFVPRLEARDPRGRGSVGAGIVLGTGVVAEAIWRPASRTSVRVTSPGAGRLGISETVARRLLAARGGALAVRLVHPLPIGQGFGMSAAGAVATGLAVGAALEVPRSRAVEVAHLADLFGGGGLGGVAAILGGGLELRVDPGIPPFGRVVRRRVDATVLVGTVSAPIRSPELLSDAARMRRFTRGPELFAALEARPGWGAFWSAAEAFTDASRLAPTRLRTVLRGLRRRGAWAAQAMFGGSFFAAGPTRVVDRAARRWLAEHGVPYASLAVAGRGARALPVGTGPPHGAEPRRRRAEPGEGRQVATLF